LLQTVAIALAKQTPPQVVGSGDRVGKLPLMIEKLNPLIAPDQLLAKLKTCLVQLTVEMKFGIEWSEKIVKEMEKLSTNGSEVKLSDDRITTDKLAWTALQIKTDEVCGVNRFAIFLYSTIP